MGEGTEGNFRAASIFFLALPHFSYRGTFSGKPWHIFGRKKIETKILWRYSLGARVVPSPSTQIGELSFTTRKILPFYKSKERKSIELSLKCMGSKTISVPFEFWNVIFFRMTNCSYRYTSCIAEDSKEINQCFLKHLHTAIVLLHKSFIFPGSWCDLRRHVYCDAQIVQHL